MFDHTPCFCFRVFPTHWSQQISCSSRVINNSPSLSASLKGREHIPCQSATLSGQLLSFISSNHFFLTVAIKCQPKCVCIFSLPALCAAACVIYNQPKHFLKCTTTLCLSYCWVRSSTWETKTKRPLTHVPLETVLHNPLSCTHWFATGVKLGFLVCMCSDTHSISLRQPPNNYNSCWTFNPL